MTIKTKCCICKKEMKIQDSFALFQNVRMCCEDCEETAAERTLAENQEKYLEECDRTAQRVRQEFPAQYTLAKMTDLTKTRYYQVKDFTISDDWCFFIQGNVGAGKTHISFITIYEFARKWNTDRVMYFNASDLVAELQEDYRSDGRSISNYNRIKNCRILLIDDLGTEKETDDSLHQIMKVVNYREQCKLKTIITTNLKMEEIKEKFHARFLSRIMSGKTIALKGDDRRADKTAENGQNGA